MSQKSQPFRLEKKKYMFLFDLTGLKAFQHSCMSEIPFLFFEQLAIIEYILCDRLHIQ